MAHARERGKLHMACKLSKGGWTAGFGGLMRPPTSQHDFRRLPSSRPKPMARELPRQRVRRPWCPPYPRRMVRKIHNRPSDRASRSLRSRASLPLPRGSKASTLCRRQRRNAKGSSPHQHGRRHALSLMTTQMMTLRHNMSLRKVKVEKNTFSTFNGSLRRAPAEARSPRRTQLAGRPERRGPSPRG